MLQLQPECTLQVLGEEWRRVALDYQAKVHRVAIIILKAIFIGLGRDEKIIDEACTPISMCSSTGLQVASQASNNPASPGQTQEAAAGECTLR